MLLTNTTPTIIDQQQMSAMQPLIAEFRTDNTAQTHTIKDIDLAVSDSLYATRSQSYVWVEPKRRSFLELKEFLLENLENSKIEIGHMNKIDEFVSLKYDQGVDAALSEIFQNNVADSEIVVKILRSAMSVPYRIVEPGLKAIAHSSLKLPSPEVRRYAVQLLSRWNDPNDIIVLKEQTYEEKWLNEYISKVVAEMEDKNG